MKGAVGGRLDSLVAGPASARRGAELDVQAEKLGRGLYVKMTLTSTYFAVLRSVASAPFVIVVAVVTPAVISAVAWRVRVVAFRFRVRVAPLPAPSMIVAASHVAVTAHRVVDPVVVFVDDLVNAF